MKRLVQVRMSKGAFEVQTTPTGEARAVTVQTDEPIHEDARTAIDAMRLAQGEWIWVTVRAAKRLGLAVARYPGNLADLEIHPFILPERYY